MIVVRFLPSTIRKFFENPHRPAIRDCLTKNYPIPAKNHVLYYWCHVTSRQSDTSFEAWWRQTSMEIFAYVLCRFRTVSDRVWHSTSRLFENFRFNFDSTWRFSIYRGRLGMCNEDILVMEERDGDNRIVTFIWRMFDRWAKNRTPMTGFRQLTVEISLWNVFWIGSWGFSGYRQ